MGNANINSKQPKRDLTCWSVTPHHSANDQRNKPQIRNITNCNKIHILSDEFIIKLHHDQMRKGITTQLCTQLAIIDKRRLVFVSLIGLYQTWHLCPAAILYSAIFVLPLKRKWIYHFKKYKKEIKQSIVSEISIFKEQTQFNQFLELLKWKDSQNLIFWALDDYKYHEEDRNDNNMKPKVAPFWRHFNEKLSTLYDPITKTTYKPINFNDKWWNFAYNSLIQSKYGVPSYEILMELHDVRMRFKPIQEMIYQSNPESLKPIVSFDTYVYKRDTQFEKESHKTSFVSLYRNNVYCDYGGFVSFPKGCCADIDNGDDNEDDNGIWMISTEYNEYKLA